MTTMSHQLVTASILLCFLAVAASGQQQLKGGQLVSAAHVGAIATSPESAISHSLASVEGSESVSSITLQEGLSGCRCVPPAAECSLHIFNCFHFM
jgi:hypothetical protein